VTSTSEVEVPAADPNEHPVDQVEPRGRHELHQPRHGGRHLGPAVGDLDRLVVKPGLQLHHGLGVSG
jgi:hypothetical protein